MRRFSDDEKARLRAWRALLRDRVEQPRDSSESIYDCIYRAIGSLDEREREQLREHVDWVADYDRASASERQT